jgi:hypothetical protein
MGLWREEPELFRSLSRQVARKGRMKRGKSGIIFCCICSIPGVKQRDEIEPCFPAALVGLLRDFALLLRMQHHHGSETSSGSGLRRQAHANGQCHAGRRKQICRGQS